MLLTAFFLAWAADTAGFFLASSWEIVFFKAFIKFWSEAFTAALACTPSAARAWEAAAAWTYAWAVALIFASICAWFSASDSTSS